MREILFRGQTYIDNIWKYGMFSTNRSESIIAVWIERIEEFIRYGVYHETVGQYTGLTDKNGKKIYEGDVLSTDNGTLSNTGRGIVKEYKGMYVSFYGQDMLERDCYDELNRVCNAREVIGNIHDNPELVEEELE